MPPLGYQDRRYHESVYSMGSSPAEGRSTAFQLEEVNRMDTETDTGEHTYCRFAFTHKSVRTSLTFFPSCFIHTRSRAWRSARYG